MKNKSKNQIPNIIRKRVSEPLWFLVGPGGSVGPAPWGPDSLERPAPQPRWSRAPLWENQGCQLPLCSPFTGNQTTPQALNCPRSQPSHCWGGGAPTMCQMPWVPPPPGVPTPRGRGSGPEAQPPLLQPVEQGRELPGNPGRCLQVGTQTQTHGDFSNPAAWRHDPPGNRTNWVGVG